MWSKRGVFGTFVGLIGAISVGQGIPDRPQIIVKFTSPSCDLTSFAVRTAFGAEIVGYNAAHERVIFEVRGGQTAEKAAAAFRSLPNVAYAEPDFEVRAFRTVNDPMVGNQWSLTNTKTTTAWDTQTGNSGVVIAVVDTGVDASHPDLNGRITSGYDFVQDDTDPNDGNGHGTHCAGIVAANADNGVGVAGVAFGCTVMPVRVLGNDGVGSISRLVSGIEWAVDHGAKIVSLSLGTASESRALDEAIDYAWDHGVLIVAAAGNESSNRPTFPAAYPKVLSVAAYNQENKRASFSNFGPWVDVAAPGAQILSTLPNNQYGLMSGTSMATPFVAGVAGLVWSQLGAGATPASVSQRIEVTCDSLSPWVVRGRVNTLAAMSEPPSPSEFELQAMDTSITGGNRPRVRVLLKKSGDTARVFSVLSSDSAILVPETYKIDRRQTNGILMLRSNAVGVATPVTITLTSGDITRTITITVNPVGVRDFKFARATINGGRSVMLGMFLDSVSPTGGLPVGLSSNDPAVIVPNSYTIRPGLRLVYLAVRTTRVATTKTVTVTLTQGLQTKSTSIQVLSGP